MKADEIVQCGWTAISAAHWVDGKRLILCAKCYGKAHHVARALGVSLAVDELRDGETVCTQRVRAAESSDYVSEPSP